MSTSSPLHSLYLSTVINNKDVTINKDLIPPILSNQCFNSAKCPTFSMTQKYHNIFQSQQIEGGAYTTAADQGPPIQINHQNIYNLSSNICRTMEDRPLLGFRPLLVNNLQKRLTVLYIFSLHLN